MSEPRRFSDREWQAIQRHPENCRPDEELIEKAGKNLLEDARFCGEPIPEWIQTGNDFALYRASALHRQKELQRSQAKWHSYFADRQWRASKSAAIAMLWVVIVSYRIAVFVSGVPQTPLVCVDTIFHNGRGASYSICINVGPAGITPGVKLNA